MRIVLHTTALVLARAEKHRDVPTSRAAPASICYIPALPMKHLLPLTIACCFVFSGCLVTGPQRGKSRKGVHNHNCHPSESWDGSKCRKRGKGHDDNKPGKGNKKK